MSATIMDHASAKSAGWAAIFFPPGNYSEFQGSRATLPGPAGDPPDRMDTRPLALPSEDGTNNGPRG